MIQRLNILILILISSGTIFTHIYNFQQTVRSQHPIFLGLDRIDCRASSLFFENVDDSFFNRFYKYKKRSAMAAVMI